MTADGQVRTVNASREPDLFWALKGGGATFGIVTRVTLATHELPSNLGATFGSVQAHSDEAFRRLVREFLRFDRLALLNPVRGEQVTVHHDAQLDIAMVFHAIDQTTADATWQPFIDWIRASPSEFSLTQQIRSVAAPAHYFWDIAFLRDNLPGLLRHDDRPGAPEDAACWPANVGEAGWYVENDESLTPADPARRGRPRTPCRCPGRGRRPLERGDALQQGPGRRVGRGDRGGDGHARSPCRPGRLRALAIVVSGGPPARPGFAGHEPDAADGRARAASVSASIAALGRLVLDTPAYPLEASYFQR